jgi:RNA polymerase sigma-70 factor, ECF subfamily
MNGTTKQVRFAEKDARLRADWTDEQLMLEYQRRGERAAFEELVRRYERDLFNYLRRYLGDAELAEDVFQQTFLQVHLKCGQYEEGREVRPWLYTIATNQAIDYQRRHCRRRMVSLDRRMGGRDMDGESMATCLEGAVAPPSEQFESDESDEQVRRAVNQLPDATRQAVLLVFFQGLKYREAAEALHVPVGTVKSRLHTALGKLQEILTRIRLPR